MAVVTHLLDTTADTVNFEENGNFIEPLNASIGKPSLSVKSSAIQHSHPAYI